MKTLFIMLSLATTALVVARTTPAHAQVKPAEMSVDASVDRGIIELGDTFEYTLDVATRGSSDIRLVEAPDFRPFSVIGRSERPQMLMSNGFSERRLQVVYRLRTRRIGDKIVINPPVVAIGSERLSPKPITVKVVKKGEAPKQKSEVRDDAIYVDTSISLDRQPYVGEQIVLQYDLFINSRKIEAQPNPPSEPSLDAFWIEELDDRTMGTRQLLRTKAGYIDKILLRRYAIYPLQAGEAVIDAMTVPVTTGGFMRKRDQIEVKSKPITLEVQPLPPGAPQDFYEGNVGEWEFLVTSDSLRTRVGRAVTIRISARGDGQVGRIKLPEIEGIKGARLGNTEQSSEQTIRNGKIIGEKLVRYAITPLEEGVLEIPALSFTYFDPSVGEYHTKQSAPIRIEVGEGELPPEPEKRGEPVSRAESSQKDVMSALKSELAGVHTRIDLSEEAPLLEGGFESSIPFRLILWGSLLLMLGVLATPIWLRFARRDSPARQRARTLREATSLLKDVQSSDDPYGEITSAIKLYCVEALALSRGHVGERELPHRLQALGVSEELATELGQILGESNRARYASSSDAESADKLAKKTRHALEQIHKALEGTYKDKPRRGRATTNLLIGLIGAGTLLAITPASVRAEAPGGAHVTVESALEAHEAHQWEEAISQWSVLATRSPRNADVHYALGTAALQHEDLGLAVLSLERARLLRPKDRDIARNLGIAERMVRVKAIESLRGRSQVLAGNDDFFWWDMARGVSGGTLAILLLIACWVVIISLLARPRIEGDVARDLTGLLAIIALITVIITGVTWSARANVMAHTHPIIMLEDRPVFRDGPSEHAAERTINSPIVAGSRHVMEEQRKGWIKVRLPDGSSGWIEEDRVGRVVQD